MKKVKTIVVGKNEAGTAEYQDTGKSIEMADVAYTLIKEDFLSGETRTLYFKDSDAAEKFKDGMGIVETLY